MCTATTLLHPTEASTTSMETLQAVLRLIEKNLWDELIVKIKEDSSVAFSSLTAATALCRGTHGNLALHAVCKYQPSVAVIEALLEANPSAVRTRGQWGYLPLHYACTSGASHHVVELLIDAYPAGTRTRDDHEETLPLHLACKWGASEAVLIAIMTTHPEGAIFRDKSGKTPMDHAIKLPTGCIMQQVIKTLELAPLMIAVSKATQRRDTDVTDNRWKGIAEAHSMDIQKWKRQSEQEHEQFKEQERSLRAQMAAVHSESKEKEQALLTQLAAVPLEIKRVEQVLQAQVQDALNQVTALTCSVEATKTELSAVLQSRSDALVELSHAIEALEKKQERICELDKITESQAAVIDELQRLVKTHVQTEQSFVVKVEDLEHSRTELKGDYNRTRGELSTARTENASLRRLLKDANIRVNLCHGRLETVQKWVQSLAFSMDTWTAEKVLVNKCSDHGKMLNMTMVTATPHDNGNSLKSSDTSETEDDISITVMEKVDDKVPKELGLPGN